MPRVIKPESANLISYDHPVECTELFLGHKGLFITPKGPQNPYATPTRSTPVFTAFHSSDQRMYKSRDVAYWSSQLKRLFHIIVPFPLSAEPLAHLELNSEHTIKRKYTVSYPALFA